MQDFTIIQSIKFAWPFRVNHNLLRVPSGLFINRMKRICFKTVCYGDDNNEIKKYLNIIIDDNSVLSNMLISGSNLKEVWCEKANLSSNSKHYTKQSQ